MLSGLGVVFFAIGWLINATNTATDAVFSPFSFLLLGLICIGLHLAGLLTEWRAPRRYYRR